MAIQALALTGIRKMEVIERPMPQLVAPNDVLIRIKYIGVCGSDIHYYTDGRIGSQVVSYPFVVGHECSGQVIAVGPEVKRVIPGDLIAIDPSIHCGDCQQCAANRPHTCLNNRFLGCPEQLEGCLTEYLVMPEFCCYPVTDRMDAEEAALLEPFSIGVYAVRLASTLLAGQRAAIFGAGPIGLSILLKLLSTGEVPVGMVDPLQYRLEKAAEMGASWIVNPTESAVLPNVLLHAPEGMDVVFEASGAQSAVDNALEILKPGGKLVLVGIPPEAQYQFNMDLMRRKEITVINVRRQNEAMEEAIQLVSERKVNLKQMVTHYFQLRKTPVAFDIVSNYADGVVKAMVFV